MCVRLAYADNVCLLCESLREVEKEVVFSEGASRVELEINQEKSKVMKVRRRDKLRHQEIQCAHMRVEAEEEFKYFGSLITVEEEAELSARITGAIRYAWSMGNLMSRGGCPEELKLRPIAQSCDQ